MYVKAIEDQTSTSSRSSSNNEKEGEVREKKKEKRDLNRSSIQLNDQKGFEPSRLGTLEFWDFNYGRELESFKDFGDEGEVWFGEDSSDEILDWIARFLPPPLSGSIQDSFIIDQNDRIRNENEKGLSLSSNNNNNNTNSKEPKSLRSPNRDRPQMLDVGCGNGQLLFLLVQGGYRVENLMGIDYSAGSIELTNEIARSKGIEGLRLEVKDIIRDEIKLPTSEIHGQDKIGWDLITDKGTFDAICLSNEEFEGKKLSENYPWKISKLLLRPSGIFLITSCNWTEDELISKFTQPGIGLRVHSKIPRPCFNFGGQSGSTITTIAFEAF